MTSRAFLPRVAAGVAALAAAACAGVFFASELRLNRGYSLDTGTVSLPQAAASLERGRHLVEVLGQCATCHGDDLGGQPMADDWSLGRLHSSNLTPGRGGIANTATRDLVRGIRHGVKPDGRPVVMMPSHNFARLSDADLGALIAYLRALPPVDRKPAVTRIGPLTRLVLVIGAVPDLLPAELLADADAAASPPPPPGLTAAYGGVLVETAGCKVCHRPDLAGGRHPLALPEEPPPPNLTPGGALAAWTEDDFVETLRRGVTPDGRPMNATYMPWPRFGRMSDTELRAIWRHLRSVPALPTSANAAA